jgi:hypothetical protein
VSSLAGNEDLHDRIHAAAVPFPHRSEPRLATEIPTENCQRLFTCIGACVILHREDKPLQCDMSFLDALHVEAYGRY